MKLGVATVTKTATQMLPTDCTDSCTKPAQPGAVLKRCPWYNLAFLVALEMNQPQNTRRLGVCAREECMRHLPSHAPRLA
jgi:hypothetical protein